MQCVDVAGVVLSHGLFHVGSPLQPYLSYLSVLNRPDVAIPAPHVLSARPKEPRTPTLLIC